ncbi:hypothetical protein HK098_001360 [Nowakowskiella sp. JEL0407]|nr:hypothetical protein HK098_001360 [Nowakowskiella sp. JEL0407]
MNERGPPMQRFGSPRILTRNADGFFQPHPESQSSPFPMSRAPNNGFYEQPSTPRPNGPRERRDPNMTSDEEYYQKFPQNGNSSKGFDRPRDLDWNPNRPQDYKKDEYIRRDDRKERERKRDDREDRTWENRPRDRSFERGDDRPKEDRRRDDRNFKEEYSKRDDRPKREDRENERTRQEKGQYYPKDRGDYERRNYESEREDYQDINFKRNDSSASNRPNNYKPRLKNDPYHKEVPQSPIMNSDGIPQRSVSTRRGIAKNGETTPISPIYDPYRNNLDRAPSRQERTRDRGDDLGRTPSRRDRSAHRDQSERNKDDNYNYPERQFKGDRSRPRNENGLERERSFRDNSPEKYDQRNLLRKSPSKPELSRADREREPMDRQGSTRSVRNRDNTPRDHVPYRDENGRQNRNNQMLKKSPSQGELVKTEYSEREPMERQGSTRSVRNRENTPRERLPFRDDRERFGHERMNSDSDRRYDRNDYSESSRRQDRSEKSESERRNERSDKSESDRRYDRTQNSETERRYDRSEKPDYDKRNDKYERTHERYGSDSERERRNFERTHERKISDRDGNVNSPIDRSRMDLRRLEPERKGIDSDRNIQTPKRSPPLTSPYEKRILSPIQSSKLTIGSPKKDYDFEDMLSDLTSDYDRPGFKKKKSSEKLNQRKPPVDPFQILQGELDAILTSQLQKDQPDRRGRRDERDKRNDAISPRSASLGDRQQRRENRSVEREEYDRQRRNDYNERGNDRKDNDRRRRDDDMQNDLQRRPSKQADTERERRGGDRDRANIIAERERRENERIQREREEEERRREKERQEFREKERDKERQREREREREAYEMKRKEIEKNKMLMRQREKESGLSPEQLLELMEKLPDVDESIISEDYVKALIITIRKDTTITPIPEDFVYSDGFYEWQRSIAQPFQEVLVSLLKARYLDPNGRGRNRSNNVTNKQSEVAIRLFLKVVEARGLSIQNTKSREPDAYCTIEFGNLDDSGKSQEGEKEFYRTETMQGTRNPVWNQHLKFTIVNLTTSIVLTVWDDKGKKQNFLGRVKLATAELINMCAKEGYVSRWNLLQPRDKNDKNIEGDVLVEMSMEDDVQETKKLAAKDPERALRRQLVETHVSFRSIYKTLLRSALALDMATLGKAITEATEDLLTTESKAILTVFGRQWAVGEAFRVTALLELLFNKYKSYEVPTLSLLKAYETLRENMKKDPSWLSENERSALTELLEQMYDYYKTQISKYKEFYPKNTPRGALETTLLMLRMIHKNQIYRETHTEVPESFRDVLKVLMTEASVNRFQKLQELTAPFDESDTEAVIDGLCRLAELLSDELQADIKYFDPPFARELVISKVTADSYLKYFILCIEQHVEMFASEEIARTASKAMFDLYKRIKRLDDRYSKLVPGLSASAGISIERWFLPFVTRWLNIISEKTLSWVQNAVKVDNFEAVNLTDKERDGKSSGLPHSTSIADVFSAMDTELHFILDLGWPNAVQNAMFLQNFAKTINRVIEQYCDAIAIGETKEEIKEATLWTSVANTAANMVKPKDLGPRDIAMESCVKLRNLEYATHKLNEISRMMNVSSVTQKQRDHRRTMAPLRKARSNKKSTLSDDESIHGAFKIEVSYAENLKAVNKNGMSNGYTIIRVPEGTVVEAPIDDDETTLVDGKDSVQSVPKPPQILNGVACELLKTRVIYDSVNPQWDETFQAILPPVNKLEVVVSSKNMLATDQVIGRADIDIGKGTRLKNRLVDHQTHEVFVELEPQGRVLIRMTLEGEDEDVEFWFRRSKERLGRTRDDFTRALVSRLTPFCRQVVLKAIKSEEPAPKGFFTALTAVPQLSEVTVGGISIDKEMSHNEVNQCLRPIFDYLDKNLGILCESLSEKMAGEVIKQIWEEMLTTLYHVLIPALYGEIERDRRVLVRRQTSVVQRTLRQLRDFFHADGEGFGLAMSVLETRKYREIELVIQAYHNNIERIKSEYESSARSAGREKEYLLRLLRLRFDRQEDLPEKDKFDGRMWVHEQLVARRDRKGL